MGVHHHVLCCRQSFHRDCNDFHRKEQPLALGWETLGRFNVREIGKARTVSCLAEKIWFSSGEKNSFPRNTSTHQFLATPQLHNLSFTSPNVGFSLFHSTLFVSRGNCSSISSIVKKYASGKNLQQKQVRFGFFCRIQLNAWLLNPPIFLCIICVQLHKHFCRSRCENPWSVSVSIHYLKFINS